MYTGFGYPIFYWVFHDIGFGEIYFDAVVGTDTPADTYVNGTHDSTSGYGVGNVTGTNTLTGGTLTGSGWLTDNNGHFVTYSF